MQSASNKRRYGYIWIALVILIFGYIFVPRIVDRLSSNTVVEDNRSIKNKAKEPLAFITLNGEKRRVPKFELTNQDNITITDEDYLGKVYLVEFFFTTCPSICPIMTENLVDLQDHFKGFQDFGVASISITPEHDTPQVLKEYAEDHKIIDEDWNLLTGDNDVIYSLANAGFNIFAAEMPDAPGGFEHSGLFALVDKKGYMRSRKDEFGNPIIYYRGTITEAEGENDHGETEQIGILKEDIKKLLSE